MNKQSIILDHKNQIILDSSNPPFNNYQAFEQNYVGLKILADSVRAAELEYIANNPHGIDTLRMFFSINPIVPCAFNWFSVTLINYLRLVALVDLMLKNKWKSIDLVEEGNHKIIKTHCRKYIQEAVPEIYTWRNKVAAHFAATDPFKTDSLGTLEQSIMNPITYHYPYYYVGMAKWNTKGSPSELREWALTKTYEDLRDRFWPEMNIKQLPIARP